MINIKYELVKSSSKDIDRIIEYKKRTIYEYEKNIKNEELDRINSYIISTISKLINDYYNIIVDNKVIGCLLITNKDDGILLDEIYLEKNYRNKGIGTNIIKHILTNNDIIYLWVYKENKKAISLYKRLGFYIIEETKSRYYMKYNK